MVKPFQKCYLKQPFLIILKDIWGISLKLYEETAQSNSDRKFVFPSLEKKHSVKIRTSYGICFVQVEVPVSWTSSLVAKVSYDGFQNRWIGNWSAVTVYNLMRESNTARFIHERIHIVILISSLCAPFNRIELWLPCQDLTPRRFARTPSLKYLVLIDRVREVKICLAFPYRVRVIPRGNVIFM